MNHALAASILASLVLVAGCAETPADEATASTRDQLHSGCGPVLYTGEGSDPSKALAFHIAEKEARQSCRQTPTFCAVDCESAPIRESRCTPSAVSGDDGSVAVTYTCEVTIAASAPSKKTECATAIRCAPGYMSVDTDGDGCNDTCELQ